MGHMEVTYLALYLECTVFQTGFTNLHSHQQYIDLQLLHILSIHIGECVVGPKCSFVLNLAKA